MRKIGFTDTTLRDGHQSLWATRMQIEDMLPILHNIDEIGYHSLEAWGGATFDVSLRYLQEDPWERLRLIKSHIKKTPLQMLLRGQSVVGYQHYADDVVREFVRLAVKNGIDIIRIFDALNDVRNMVVPIEASKEAGAHVQGAVVYTVSPVHTLDHFVEKAQALAELGCDSICIKDMAGLLTPYRAYELIARIKDKLDILVQLHSHYIGGLAIGAYIKAADAGVDVIDTASLPLAFGASQPPVETVVKCLEDSEVATGLYLSKLFEIADFIEELRKRRGHERGVTRIAYMRVFEHQIPGGMISNFVSQLEQQKAAHRINEVLDEIPKVREELGYPPLVTPTSQIVGTQAVLNVLSGERYKMVPGEVKAYVHGEYGEPPGKINPIIQKKIIGNDKPLHCRPADLLEPAMEKARQECAGLARSPEDVISYVLFPQIAKKFLEDRQNGTLQTPEPEKPVLAPPRSIDQQPVVSRAATFKEEKKVNLKDIKELVKLLDDTAISELDLESEGVKISIKKNPGISASGTPAASAPVVIPAPAEESAQTPAVKEHRIPEVSELQDNCEYIKSPMVGTFYVSAAPEAEPFVQSGQQIQAGQVVCIIEAMKLMNEIESDFAGKIMEILVENGQPVEFGQPLFVVAK
ncbi:MAG: acetyl-CoA carboxylase biotin carboxyl carrier protein [Peptococcaceae bacterium]|jgi:oxaloacetate decarboxylase alpha subunit|nr:acetyl-CoA carboxylase biotin carboxyl carrier protein [Peptococcaceae bacterium]